MKRLVCLVSLAVIVAVGFWFLRSKAFRVGDCFKLKEAYLQEAIAVDPMIAFFKFVTFQIVSIDNTVVAFRILEDTEGKGGLVLLEELEKDADKVQCP